MQPKQFSILLFASLGLNVFLGGLWVGSRFSSHPKPHRDHHAHMQPHGASPREAPPLPEDTRGDHERKRRSFHHGDHDAHRDHGGPEELMILRRMVRVMGGPDDPRVGEIREKSRDDIRDTRQKMRSARQQVQDALAAEPFDKKALSDALQTLNEAGTAGRSRAQEALVHLASQMTPEERATLRKRITERDGNGKKGPPGSKGGDRPARLR